MGGSVKDRYCKHINRLIGTSVTITPGKTATKRKSPDTDTASRVDVACVGLLFAGLVGPRNAVGLRRTVADKVEGTLDEHEVDGN